MEINFYDFRKKIYKYSKLLIVKTKNATFPHSIFPAKSPKKTQENTFQSKFLC